jgi:hypothetical protein
LLDSSNPGELQFAMKRAILRFNWAFTLALAIPLFAQNNAACADQTRTIDGQIFIRTEGGENIKLSLVNVGLFDQKAILQHLDDKSKGAAPVVAYFEPLLKEAEEAKRLADAADDLAGKADTAVELASINKTDASAEVQAAIDAVGTEDKTDSPLAKVAREAGIPIDDDLAPISKHLKETEDAASDAIKRAKDRTGGNSTDSDQDPVTAANSAVDTAVKEIKDAAEKLSEKASAISAEVSNRATYPLSAIYYCSDLPEPQQTTKTDADGKFTFKVPSGAYVLVATSSRNAGVDVIGDESFPRKEFYYWMVKVDASSDQTIMLANDNLSSSGSPDSLISAQDYDSGTAEDIPALTAFIRDQKEQARQAQLQVYRNDPRAAQRKATELYPALAVAGSPLNKEFITRMQRYQKEKPDFFTDPDWPIRLAKECDDDVKTSPSQQ